MLIVDVLISRLGGVSKRRWWWRERRLSSRQME